MRRDTQSARAPVSFCLSSWRAARVAAGQGEAHGGTLRATERRISASDASHLHAHLGRGLAPRRLLVRCGGHQGAGAARVVTRGRRPRTCGRPHATDAARNAWSNASLAVTTATELRIIELDGMADAEGPPRLSRGERGSPRGETSACACGPCHFFRHCGDSPSSGELARADGTRSDATSGSVSEGASATPYPRRAHTRPRHPTHESL